MADNVQFKITGVEEVNGKLDELQQDIRYRGGRFALRKAAAIVEAAAKQNAKKIDDPETRNSIEANIAIRFSTRTFKRTGNLMWRVGILGGAAQYANNRQNRGKRRAGKKYTTEGSKDNPGGDTFYWRHIEFGTSRSRARPFFRRALYENIETATAAFVANYDKAIARAIKRAKKKKV